MNLSGNSFEGFWLCVGDFNGIQGRFWAFMNHFGMVDLVFKGNLFTWSNERTSSANIK
jgi:hypothetical protein